MMKYDEAMVIFMQMEEEYHLEQYIDFAGLCNDLANYCKAGLVIHDDDGDPVDEIERENLIKLQTKLKECADLFRDCDPYYREQG